METQAKPKKANEAPTAKTTRHLPNFVMTAVFRPGETRPPKAAWRRRPRSISSLSLSPRPAAFRKADQPSGSRLDRRRLRRFPGCRLIIGGAKTQCQTKSVADVPSRRKRLAAASLHRHKRARADRTDLRRHVRLRRFNPTSRGTRTEVAERALERFSDFESRFGIECCIAEAANT